MTQSEFINLIKKDLNYEPTAGQEGVLTVFAQFLADRNPRSVMVLRGSAGTGKTTVAAAIAPFRTETYPYGAHWPRRKSFFFT